MKKALIKDSQEKTALTVMQFMQLLRTGSAGPSNRSQELVAELKVLVSKLARPSSGPESLDHGVRPRVVHTTVEGLLAIGLDLDFVAAAYRMILGRDPDSEGMTWFLSSLHSRALTRMDVIQRLYLSTESRQNRKPIPDIKRAIRRNRAKHLLLNRLAFVSKVFRWLVAVIRIVRVGERVYLHDAILERERLRLGGTTDSALREQVGEALFVLAKVTQVLETLTAEPRDNANSLSPATDRKNARERSRRTKGVRPSKHRHRTHRS